MTKPPKSKQEKVIILNYGSFSERANFGTSIEKKFYLFSNTWQLALCLDGVAQSIKHRRSLSSIVPVACIIKFTMTYLRRRTELSRYLWMFYTDTSFDLYDSVTKTS